MRIYILLPLLADFASSYRIRLFTSTWCRQCIRFEKEYRTMVEKYPSIKFDKLLLDDEGNRKLAMDSDIHCIPTLVFEDEENIVCTPRNYDEIYRKLNRQE